MIPLRGVSRTQAKFFLGFTLLFFYHTLGYGQIDELANQVNEAERGAERIGNSLFSIIKWAAGILLAIAALAFLIIREQNQDMARKIGNLITGLVIFYGIMELAETIAN